MLCGRFRQRDNELSNSCCHAFRCKREGGADAEVEIEHAWAPFWFSTEGMWYAHLQRLKADLYGKKYMEEWLSVSAMQVMRVRHAIMARKLVLHRKLASNSLVTACISKGICIDLGVCEQHCIKTHPGNQKVRCGRILWNRKEWNPGKSRKKRKLSQEIISKIKCVNWQFKGDPPGGIWHWNKWQEEVEVKLTADHVGEYWRGNLNCRLGQVLGWTDSWMDPRGSLSLWNEAAEGWDADSRLIALNKWIWIPDQVRYSWKSRWGLSQLNTAPIGKLGLSCLHHPPP